MSRTLAIGDIHGCSAALRTLVTAIELQADDTLVLLGDYVDRGPDTKGAIDFILALRSQCRLVTLTGNHELMMLGAREDEHDNTFWRQFGGVETLESYGETFDDVPETHWEFLHSCVPYYEIETHFFVHANYHPQQPLAKQDPSYRYWEHLTGYFVPAQHVSGKTAIVGHTAQRKGHILDLGHVICIDTCCHGGGWLTAIEVSSRQYWQASREGMLHFSEPRFLLPREVPPTK